MHVARWLLLVGLLPLAGCSCRRGCGPAPAEPVISAEPTVAAAAALAPAYPAPRTAERVADLLCLNEAVAVPARVVRSRQVRPEVVTAMLEDDARLSAQLGVGSVRVNSAAYPFLNHMEWQRHARSRDRADRAIVTIQQAGMEPIVVLGPWPGNQTANYTEHYVPDDMAAYQAWVRTVVERYDGDGVDDAPGLLRGVRLWEVDNEPDLHNRVVPKDAVRELDPSTFETSEQYAEVLIATAAAVREAQPEALVLNGGTFHTGRDHGRAYMERVMAVPGAAEAVDVWSAHAYFEERSPELYLASLDNAMALAAGRPLFITETGVPSSRRGQGWVDEDFQARMLAFVYGEAMARGVERICWHTLADPPAGPASSGGFATHSLHRTVGEPPQQRREPKLAGLVYQRIAERLGSVPLAVVERVELPAGRAVKLGEAGWFVYEGEAVELPVGAGGVYDLLSGTSAPFEGRATAPCIVTPEVED
jgi:hypothetical protein